jgi:hypothetical protein
MPRRDRSEPERKAELERLRRENQALRDELWRQWLDNHAEHCGEPWPHEGRCGWPLPPELGGS